MKILVVEDDFTSRKILTAALNSYGQVDAAINGKEALKMVDAAYTGKAPYDLICLDIMMPEMDGQEALKRIRELEKNYGKEGLEGVKVIMTTALDDNKNILKAFSSQCESYVVKPIDKAKLLEEMKKLGLMGKNEKRKLET